MLIGFCLLAQTHRQLDLLQLGEPEAEFMGVDVAYLKKQIVFASALGVGAAVSLAGMIGFIGLVVPHLVRGVTHRALSGGRFIAHVGRYHSEDCHSAGGNPGESYNQCDWRAVFSLVNCAGPWVVALAAVDISVALNGKDIVSKVSLEAADGCITALVGPNGAGKTC